MVSFCFDFHNKQYNDELLWIFFLSKLILIVLNPEINDNFIKNNWY